MLEFKKCSQYKNSNTKLTLVLYDLLCTKWYLYKWSLYEMTPRRVYVKIQIPLRTKYPCSQWPLRFCTKWSPLYEVTVNRCPQWIDDPSWFSGHMFKGQGQITLEPSVLSILYILIPCLLPLDRFCFYVEYNPGFWTMVGGGHKYFGNISCFISV